MAMAQVKTCSSSTSMPSAAELGRHVAAGALAVVGQEAKRDVARRSSSAMKRSAPGISSRAAVNDAVHVDQKAVPRRWSQEHETSFVALWWSGRGLARVREGVVASKWER